MRALPRRARRRGRDGAAAARGVTFWTEAESLGEGTGIRTVCFNDPDGTVLQLIQGV